MYIKRERGGAVEDLSTNLKIRTHTHTCTNSAIAKARENVISDAMSEITASFSKALPESMMSELPSTQPEVVAKKKGHRSPAHLPPPTQRTVTVTLKDLSRTEVGDVMSVYVSMVGGGTN